MEKSEVMDDDRFLDEKAKIIGDEDRKPKNAEKDKIFLIDIDLSSEHLDYEGYIDERNQEVFESDGDIGVIHHFEWEFGKEGNKKYVQNQEQFENVIVQPRQKLLHMFVLSNDC